MSSKNADTQLVRTSWSITARLAVFFALMSTVILACAIWILYLALDRSLTQADERFLSDKIEVLRDILREPGPDYARLEEEVRLEIASYQFTQYYARVVIQRGNVLIETPGMADMLPLSVFPTLDQASHNPEDVHWGGLNRRRYLLMAARAGSSSTVYIIQVGLDISQQTTLLAEYRQTLFFVLILGVVLAAATGAVVARLGLRPLRRIAHQIQEVSAQNLNTRLSSTEWPHEVTSLATAFDSMMHRLEEAFLRLSRFSADIAHELRTPIGTLMGEAEVALTRTRSIEEYQLVLASSLEECGRLARLIESLLFLARADNTEMSLQLSHIDVQTLVCSVRDFFEAVAEQQAVRVSVKGNARLRADPLLLRRALSNLLDNALRHTPRGGHVEILVQTDQNTHIHFRDTGDGIAAEHLPFIFDRFYRVDEARSQSTEGSGLGLAIVKTIIELHGGTVVIESVPGEGTHISLHFPRQASST